MPKNGKQLITATKDNFTILPNLYDELGLTPHEFRLLAHYRRVGTCWESVETTAKKCRMNKNTVIHTRKQLETKTLIKTSTSEKGTILISITDIWERNEKYFAAIRKEVMGHLKRGNGSIRKEVMGASEKRETNNITVEEDQQKNTTTTHDETPSVNRNARRRKRNVAVVVETHPALKILSDAGIGPGAALNNAQAGLISQRNASEWAEWLSHPGKTFKNPLAYCAVTLGKNPSMHAPRHQTAQGENSAQLNRCPSNFHSQMRKKGFEKCPRCGWNI